MSWFHAAGGKSSKCNHSGLQNGEPQNCAKLLVSKLTARNRIHRIMKQWCSLSHYNDTPRGMSLRPLTAYISCDELIHGIEHIPGSLTAAGVAIRLLGYPRMPFRAPKASW